MYIQSWLWTEINRASVNPNLATIVARGLWKWMSCWSLSSGGPQYGISGKLCGLTNEMLTVVNIVYLYFYCTYAVSKWFTQMTTHEHKKINLNPQWFNTWAWWICPFRLQSRTSVISLRLNMVPVRFSPNFGSSSGPSNCYCFSMWIYVMLEIGHNEPGGLVGHDGHKVAQCAIEKKTKKKRPDTRPHMWIWCKNNTRVPKALIYRKSYVNIRICFMGLFLHTRHILQVYVAVIKVQLQAFITQGLLWKLNMACATAAGEANHLRSPSPKVK